MRRFKVLLLLLSRLLQSKMDEHSVHVACRPKSGKVDVYGYGHATSSFKLC